MHSQVHKHSQPSGHSLVDVFGAKSETFNVALHSVKSEVVNSARQNQLQEIHDRITGSYAVSWFKDAVRS